MSVVVEGTPPPAAGLPGTIVVPGQEARHTIGSIVAGDLGVWPRFRIRDIIGLRASPDGEVAADPAIGRVGELRRRRERRGKTVAYELTVEGRNLHEWRRGQALAQGVFAADGELQVTIAQHPSLVGRVPAVTYRASVASMEAATEEPASPHGPHAGYEQDIALALRMHDPRFYLVAPVTAQTAAFGVEEGLTLPANAPLRIAAPDVTSGYVTVENAGAVDTDPIIDIHGPVSAPTLHNQTTGGVLTFPSLRLAAGEFLRIDFFARTVRRDGVADYRRYLYRPASTWWDTGIAKLAPGKNIIRLHGVPIANPARAVLTFQPATL